MKIEVELIKNSKNPNIWDGWKVSVGDKYSDGMDHIEAIGLVSALILGDDKSHIDWLKTEAQHKANRINTGR